MDNSVYKIRLIFLSSDVSPLWDKRPVKNTIDSIIHRFETLSYSLLLLIQIYTQFHSKKIKIKNKFND